MIVNDDIDLILKTLVLLKKILGCTKDIKIVSNIHSEYAVEYDNLNMNDMNFVHVS